MEIHAQLKLKLKSEYVSKFNWLGAVVPLTALLIFLVLCCCSKDVHNIQRAFKTGCVMKHADDHTSVDIWVQAMNEMSDSPVTLYKPQGRSPDDSLRDLSTADFALGLQTCTQRTFMQDFGTNRMVCLDSTHGTNQYCFNVVTMMVIDDFGEGIPGAFLISNIEDETVLKYFFSSLSAKLPDGVHFTASHIMTDDASQYYSAWRSVFGECEKKLCTWHVDRAWRRAIKQHICGTEDQVEVYHMLRSVMQELNEVDFERYLAAFVRYINSGAPQFAAYFTPYCLRVTEWTYCHRLALRRTRICTLNRSTMY